MISRLKNSTILLKKLDDSVEILTVSIDLLFAWKRGCYVGGVDHVKVVSDHKDRDFAFKYGIYVKELGLLARVVFIIDENFKVKYKQIVKEIANEPDYDDVLKNL